MVRYRRSRIANAPYFLTVTLRDRRSTFLTDHIALLRAAFQETAHPHPFDIDAVVVLPEHFHLLCSLPVDDADFSTRVRLIKRHFTRALVEQGVLNPGQRDARRGEYGLWQRRFWEHTIGDEQDYARHVDYILYNPVKHGLVRAVGAWPHSSFHRFVRQGLLPPDWGGTMPAQPEPHQWGEP